MMQQSELAALRAQADAIHTGDVHLGRFLHKLIDHLAQLSDRDETAPRLKAVAKEDTTNGN